MVTVEQIEGNWMRIRKVRARRLREGDQLVVTVQRVMGMQGRRPREGARLMKVECADGSTEVMREDQPVQILSK
jgi:hypothetical protein